MVPPNGLAARVGAQCWECRRVGAWYDKGKRLNRQMLGFSMMCEALNPLKPVHGGDFAVQGRKQE